MTHQLIDQDLDLDAAAAELSGAKHLYIDTEFESNRGGTTLSVIQISRGEKTYLVDALKLGAMESLGKVLGDGNAEWVLHAGLQDIGLLQDRFGLEERPRVFDTQVAWALLGAEHSVSLAYLTFRLLDIRTMKSHQTDDWKRRPLPARQLAYAAQDVEHLPAIRTELGKRLAELDREKIAIEATADQLWPASEPPTPLRLETFRNSWQLEAPNHAALRYLIEWYNSLGERQRDGAPLPKTFISIASRLPETGKDLARIKGIPGRWASRHGNELASRLRRASRDPEEGFEATAPPAYATFEEIQLDAWLGFVRAEMCAELRVAPELGLPSRLVKRMKLAITDGGDRLAGADELSGWRRTLFLEPYTARCTSATA